MKLLFFLLVFFPTHSCSATCPLALASYFISPNQTLTIIANLFNIEFGQIKTQILPFNKQIPSQDSIIAGTRVNIPFPCDQFTNNSFLSHAFTYTTTSGDTYNSLAMSKYANLTTAESLSVVNSYPPTRIPTGASLDVSVNCSCGKEDISPDYGLFLTYPLRSGDDINSVATDTNFTNLELLRKYNPGSDFKSGIVFVPAKDQSGNYPPFPASSNKGISGGAIAGIIIAVIILLLGVGTYLYLRRKAKKSQLIPSSLDENSILHSNAATDIELSSEERNASMVRGFTVDKSVEFSYEELAKATNDFSMTHKIGEGGFGAVYYAELRGEKAAIKKMDMQATREFLAELKVLTNVHHLNLVRLIGYCTEFNLFLVYEFIENGNLSQHLRGSDKEPLEWSTRVQIALDSARGLEYIHEHTVPVYIHRDIKPANILLNNQFHAKVADFGLTKLTEVGGMTQPTRLVGTFGYMPPEYAQFGDVSPKIDVYAFGVVLYELISAKEAVVRAGPGTESMGLVAMFEEALNKPDPSEHLKQLIDPRLGNNYPVDSVHKVSLLAKACTHENPQLRPSMRTIVVALMTLSSNTEDWDVASFYGNQAMLNLMSGR